MFKALDIGLGDPQWRPLGVFDYGRREIRAGIEKIVLDSGQDCAQRILGVAQRHRNADR